MSTRSLTIVKNSKDKILVNIYKHSDGDPECYGKALAEFLDGLVIVSGFNTGSNMVANGIECLAAQIIAYFKNKPGDIYIYPANVKDVGEEYVYVVTPDDVNKQYVKIKVMKITEDAHNYKKREIFHGTPNDLLKFIGVGHENKS